MSQTISGTYAGNVTLSGNPATITNTATISGTSSGAVGVIGPTGTAWVLTNLGQISETGRIGFGVSFAAGGTIINASSGTISVGLAAGNGHSYGIRLAAGGSVTNQAGGSIGGYSGVNALSGSLTLVNAGTITANMAALVGNAIIITAGGGTITNQTGGTIAGCYGIYQRGGTLTVTNAGLINAGDFGVAAAAGTVVNQASIISLGTRAAGYGVGLLGAGTISNLGATSVIEGFTGVQALSSDTVINAGTIESNRGTIGVAVKFAAGTNRLIVDPGAVFIGQVTAAGTSTLELASSGSTGTLTGLGTQFVGFNAVTVDSGANWQFSGANTLASGITLTNSGTLTDSGTLLNGGTLTGNRLNMDGGVLTNQASGVLSAAYIYGVAAGTADTVVNLGTLAYDGRSAIYLAAGGSVTNAASALISGYGSAVKLKGTVASLTNLGQITGTGAPNSYGVYLRDGGRITNGQAGVGTSTASIQGYYGLTFKTADIVNAYGTLANYGTVLGTGAVSDGVLLSNAGTVFNGQSGATAALIQGGRFGVSDEQGAVVNNATIIAIGAEGGDYGVFIDGAGSVANLGTTSLIEGYGGVQVGLDGTIVNAGTIASNQGTTGVAVEFIGGDARLIDDPGAVFIGSIFGGEGGSAVLELASAASAGTITGLGTSVTNFTSLVFDAGAHWTVAGNDAANGLGTMSISGFASGNTIDLTGFLATGQTFSNNALVLNDGTGGQATLAIQGTFSTNNFMLAADGNGGTDITVETAFPPVIAGTVGGQTVNDSATALPFSGVAITDANGSQSETVTITVTNGGLPTDADGTLSGSGLIETNTGTYELTAASAAAATTALDAVVFTPTANQVAPGDTVTTGFTLAVTDMLSETATDTATTVIATSVNDAPSISGTVGDQALADNATLAPFSGVVVADPDVGASETVTITLTDSGSPTDADGTLSGTGLSKTGTGTYALAVGTPGAVTTALDAVVFTPTAHEVSPGGTVTTGFTLSVTDGLAESPVIDTTTSVVTTVLEIVPCFAAGTRLATPRGAILVECLREGDILLTVSGKRRPIQWIGRRTVDCKRHSAPDRVKPICIVPHAFGENRPNRALRLSPDHAVFVDGVLIPVKHLVNGTTVTQLDVSKVTYYHIELPAHDVVLAEGLPAETYLETGGRSAFENGGSAMQLHPDFVPDEARIGMVWQCFGYAPFASDGQLDRVRGQLACQALMLGYSTDSTSQPKKRARRAVG